MVHIKNIKKYLIISLAIITIGVAVSRSQRFINKLGEVYGYRTSISDYRNALINNDIKLTCNEISQRYLSQNLNSIFLSREDIQPYEVLQMAKEFSPEINRLEQYANEREELIEERENLLKEVEKKFGLNEMVKLEDKIR